MNGTSAAATPALGVFSLAGVLLVFAAWHVLRAAGARTRAVAAATGLALFAIWLATALQVVGRLTGMVAVPASVRGGLSEGPNSSGRYLLLALGGFVLAAAAVWAVRRLAACSGETPPDAGDRAPANGAGWVDVAALALALALLAPLRNVAPERAYDRATLAVVLYLIVAGVLQAAPLLVLAARADLRDRRLAGAAFALVAAAAVLAPFGPNPVEHFWWLSFGFGLVLGLLASSVALVAGGVPGHPGAAAVGVAVGLALILLSNVLLVRGAVDTFERRFAAPVSGAR